MILLLISVIFQLTFSTTVIKIGHLHPNDPDLRYEELVLKFCIEDLRKKGILPKEIEFHVDSMESCNKFSGVENAAFMHYKGNASVYFGPGCNNEMLTIGRLASFWNVPIIAHLSGNDALSNRREFDTLGSVALTSATEMARATLTFLKLYGWKQIGIVRSSTNFDRLSIHALKNLLSQNQIAVNIEIELDPLISPDEIIATGKLKQLKNKARIIVVEMGMDFQSARSFLTAAHRSEMKDSEFVYIIPWLSHLYDHLPWESTNVDRNEVKRAFESTIVITAHGYDKEFVDGFKSRFSRATGINTGHRESLAYISLYDALYLYGISIQAAYEDTKNASIFLNGKFLWNKMTNRQFDGATGKVLMNNKAMRVPSYAAYQITNGRMKITVELTAKLLDKESCNFSELDCSEYIATQIIPNWSTYDGSMPIEIPKCGFDESLCDYSQIFVVIGVLVFFALIAFVAYLIRARRNLLRLHDLIWKIDRASVHLLESTTSPESNSLLGGTTTNRSDPTGSFVIKANSRLKTKQAIANGMKCAYKRYRQTRFISFSKDELNTLKNLKLLEYPNLNSFLGLCFNQQNEFIVLWILCQRGSLEDILFNEDLNITQNFQLSFARDVVKGLHYIHNSAIKKHGMLCLQNCVVDSNWIVKLTNFVTEWLISDKIRHNEIRRDDSIGQINRRDTLLETEPEILNDSSESIETQPQTYRSILDDADESTYKKIIQQAPEIIREIVSTKFIPHGSPAADIYSLGMVLYQILFKLEPFHEYEMEYSKILEKLATTDENVEIMRPTFPNQNSADESEAYSLELISTIDTCWLESPEARPNSKHIKTIVTESFKSKAEGTLVDQMIQMMEDYSANLEELVKERTAMLEDAQQRADRLLKNMLPESIAEDLKMGKPVVPQLYDSATVLFISINNFTRISNMSTAIQIVDFLNDLFSGFDDIISKHDAHKADTYLIVSGVPKENGNTHMYHCCEISLKIRSFVSGYRMSYKVDEILQVKVGFHTGAVAAGVIGLSAPRFCIFGDTVNMASRMQSLTLPSEIQISEQTYHLVQCYYPTHYVWEARGRIEVKGKGQTLVYFLRSKKQ